MALQIKPSLYRGVPGFKVRGTVAGTIGRVSVWTRYRDLAERIRASLKAGSFEDDEAAIWAEEKERNDYSQRQT